MSLERKITVFLIVGSALIAALPHSALAQDSNTYLYLAHAAPGRNISSSTNPEFPIDVSENGTCIAQGLSFGEIRGPFTVPAGTISFRISKANADTPCAEPAVFTANPRTTAGAAYVGAISLNTSNNITGRLYKADLSPVAVGWARALIVNATNQNLSATVNPAPTTDGSGGQFPVPANTIKAATPPLGFRYSSVYLQGPILFKQAQGPLRVCHGMCTSTFWRGRPPMGQCSYSAQK